MSFSEMIPALGRPFELGMLYDRRSEELILDKTLWSPDRLNEAVKTVTKPNTNSEVFTEDTFEDKTSAFGMHGSLKLSFLGGLFHVQGAAKYLDDMKTSKCQSRVVLKYETTTELKQLNMEHLGKGKVQHPEILDHDIATDVVVGILYGVKAFMIFDKEVSKHESLNEVHGNTKMLVKALPGMTVNMEGSVEITEDQKKISENLHCKMYADFHTEENPTNYEDAVRVYKRLPSIIGQNRENEIPIDVYLCPLSEIDSNRQRMVREIGAKFLNKTFAIQNHLQSIKRECNDLIKEDACSSFTTVKQHLISFRNNINSYMMVLQQKLMPLFPSIRGGVVEETELGKIFEEKESSPFAQSLMDSWIEEKKKEIKRLQGIIKFLSEQETVIASPEAVDNVVNDVSYDQVVCCIFRIATGDAQILSMDEYLAGNDVPGLVEFDSNMPREIKGQNVNKKIRGTLRDFAELKAANEDNDVVKFIATDATPCADFIGTLGASIYLYDQGELVTEDFKPLPKPEKPKVKDVQVDTIQLCWNDLNCSKNKLSKYNVQYKPKTETSSDWTTQYTNCSEEVKQMATISELEPASSYLFRVCAVKEIAVSKYSDTLFATTKPTSPPGKPMLSAATIDTITISFTKPNQVGKGVNIEKYKIQWCKDGNWMEENTQYTESEFLTSTIKGIQQGSSYEFRVTTNCGDAGESEASPLSDSLSPSQLDPCKFLGLCDLVEAPKDGKPAVYALPLYPVHSQTNLDLNKFEINLDTDEISRFPDLPEKVIMVVGSTGSGKTTTVNGMINYILGVQWKDNFRLKMIHEVSSNQGTETIGNQAHSQTQFVTCYTLHHMERFKVPYTLTLVDTPGFGDTRGIHHDKAITEKIRTFFNTKGSVGIDHVDAICFLVQAGNPRLTPTQQYVFDRILSMFGKDIKNNICVFFTFADGQKPQALSAMLEAGILENEDGNFFKFNNSALFVSNSGEDDEENFERMFWRMGNKNFEKFFTSLAKMEPKSLVLTKQVLDERAHLEVKVSGLREKISLGINTLSRLQQENRIFSQHAADIKANRDFEYTVKEATRVAVKLDPGTFTTNCNICNYTCHYPCRIPQNKDKSNCSAMSGENCRECPSKCHWTKHVNDQYRYETKYEDVKKKYGDIKNRFDTALQGHNKVEAVIKVLEKEFIETESIVLCFVSEMHLGLKKLSEIALKEDPLQQVDYLDLLIKSESSQAKPGWKERIDALKKTRDAADEINRLAKPGYDPWIDYRENEGTRTFLQQHTSKAKHGFLSRGLQWLSKKMS